MQGGLLDVYRQTRTFTTVNDLVVYAADLTRARHVVLWTPAEYAKKQKQTRQAVYNKIKRGTLPTLACPGLCLVVEALEPIPEMRPSRKKDG